MAFMHAPVPHSYKRGILEMRGRIRTQAYVYLFFALSALLALAPRTTHAQSGNSGTIAGTVTDPSGAAVPGATIQVRNPVSGLDRSTTTDQSGAFRFPNVPFNPYHLTVAMQGFSAFVQDVDVRSVVPVTLAVQLKVPGSSTTVTVEGGADLTENDPTFHTDVDRQLFQKLPLESQSS